MRPSPVMWGSTITVSKFVGTISLGLLTGVSYTLSTSTLPSLLTLPTAPHCGRTLSHLSTAVKRHQNILRAITSVAMFSAYLLASRRGRHPYLLYVGFLTALSGKPFDIIFEKVNAKNGNASESKLLGGEGWEKWDEEMGSDGGQKKVVTDQEEEVNGEEVRNAVEQMRIMEYIRGGISSVALIMGLVGLWGDGV